jgi:hypothetical protein
LGSIGYDPIWFFYRGPEVKSSDFQVIAGHSKYFSSRKVSVGVEGSGTHAQTSRIIELSGLDRAGLQFVNFPGEKAVKALQSGEIDGAFIVDMHLKRRMYKPCFMTLTLHLVTFKRAKHLLSLCHT